MITDPKCRTRKRIWEIDCQSVDASIAASFDWKELVNLLESAGHKFSENLSENLFEIHTQGIIHHYCHSENALSLKIEHFLTDWHQEEIKQISTMRIEEVMNLILNIQFENKNLGGLFWAIGGDPRKDFDCLRRRFHQRFQIVSIRKFSYGFSKAI